jgi:IS5 family transposase
MLRLCLLQYLYGDSDRHVIENARINLAYKYFLGLAVDEDVPDDTTISCFRVQRLGEEKFRQVFEQIVKQCMDKGLVKGRRQIIDSTHIIADIAINSLTGLIKLCRRNVLKSVEKQDSVIAEKLGINNLRVVKQDRFTRMEEGLEQEVDKAKTLLDGITEEFRSKKIRITPELQKDLELLEKAVADREEEAKDRLVSPIDPDARAGKKEHKSWTCYKGHVVVEEDSEIITAIETTPANKDDGSQLKPLLKQQEQTYDLIPDELSGDKAYGTGANLATLESKHITGYVSLKEKYNRMRPDLFTQDDFKYDPVCDTLICPAGCMSSHSKKDIALTEKVRRNGIIFQFNRNLCRTC